MSSRRVPGRTAMRGARDVGGESVGLIGREFGGPGPDPARTDDPRELRP